MKQLVLTEEEFNELIRTLGSRFIHDQVRPIIDNLYVMYDKQNPEEVIDDIADR